MVEWKGEDSITPLLPLEYKLYKVVQFFGIEKDRNLSPEEIDSLYEKLRALVALDSVEFPGRY